MAYKVQPFYNLDAPVGAGQPNQPLDVKLVQYLLLKVASRTADRWTPPGSSLAVDGKYTPALSEWIKSYQSVVLAVKDGVVHPQSNPHWKHYGTIVSINASYRNHFGGARHDNLINEADLPGDLKIALSAANAKPAMGTMP